MILTFPENFNASPLPAWVYSILMVVQTTCLQQNDIPCLQKML